MEEAYSVDPSGGARFDTDQRCICVTRLVIWGMVCPNCATRIFSRLIALNGVIEAHVDHGVSMAEVVFDGRLTDIPTLIHAIAQAGDGRHTYGAAMTHVPPSGLSRRMQAWIRGQGDR